jgi:hypothetical protein
MSTEVVFQDDLGTALTVDTGVALASATKTELHIRQPDGNVLERTCSYSGNSLTYTTVAADWAKLGTHRLCAYVEFSGTKHTGTAFEIEVKKKYEDIGE